LLSTLIIAYFDKLTGNEFIFSVGSGLGVGGQNIRDLEYGYSTSVYSTPSANYNTAYQREKQFGNGMGPAGSAGSNATSNTCIVSNVNTSLFLFDLITGLGMFVYLRNLIH